MSEIEINDYLSKCDKDLANNIIYRVYGMPGPIFMENDTPTPGPEPPTPPTPGPDYSIPFYVENITQETETLTITSYDLPITIETSADASHWETLGTIGEGDPYQLTAQLQPNNKLYVRATTDTWCNSVDDEGTPVGCTISGISKVGGNIMSLIYGSSFTGEETTFPSNSTRNFAGLFKESSNLISASELILPATTLTNSCYMHMFHYCDELTTAPSILPATTLASACYKSMFMNCRALTTAPQLPATTLAEFCYDFMFYGCGLLTTAPTLPATTLTDCCYRHMFQGCDLTTAPTLPATTLVQECYYGMFDGCSGLNYIKCLATDISATDCTYNWVNSVAETGTFVKNPSMSGWTIDANGIPSGWTVQDATD